MDAVRPARILLLGDSITELSFDEGGWGARLAHHFKRRADVINRGFGGYNSRWVYPLLPRILPPTDPPPHVVTVFLGANDSVFVGTVQHVPLENYKANIANICNYFTKTMHVPAKSVFVITPPPLCESQFEAFCREGGFPANRRNEITIQYAQAAMEVGTELGVTTVDLFSSMSQQSPLDEYLSDGLHLSSKGSEFLFGLLKPDMEEKLQGFRQMFPDSDDINAQNVDEIFDSRS